MSRIITRNLPEARQKLHSYRCVGCQRPGYDAMGRPLGPFFGIVLTRRRRDPKNDVSYMVNGTEHVADAYETPFVCSRACLAFAKAWSRYEGPEVDEITLEIDGTHVLDTCRAIDGERIHVMHSVIPEFPPTQAELASPEE